LPATQNYKPQSANQECNSGINPQSSEEFTDREPRRSENVASRAANSPILSSVWGPKRNRPPLSHSVPRGTLFWFLTFFVCFCLGTSIRYGACAAGRLAASQALVFVGLGANTGESLMFRWKVSRYGNVTPLARFVSLIRRDACAMAFPKDSTAEMRMMRTVFHVELMRRTECLALQWTLAQNWLIRI
jgi:hypothetical protein